MQQLPIPIHRSIAILAAIAIGILVCPPFAKCVIAEPAGKDAEWCEQALPSHECVMSQHFVVRHDITDATIDEYVTAMEDTYVAVVGFLQSHDIRTSPVPHRLRVKIDSTLPSRRHHHLPPDIARRWVAPCGGYDKKHKYTTIALPPSDSETQHAEGLRRTAIRLTIRHEIAHQVIDHLLPGFNNHAPDWLAEGIACAFESEAEEHSPGTLMWNKWRATDAIALLKRDNARYMIEEAMNWSGRTLSDEMDNTDVYALAWALVHHAHTRRSHSFANLLNHLALDDTASARTVRLQIEYTFTRYSNDLAASLLKHLVSSGPSVTADVRSPDPPSR